MEPINIEKETERFLNFLNTAGNNRIIFSGPFGTGKTYFLKKVLADSNDYLPLYVYPVNYSVSSNEDIFELIKYDILYELLRHKVLLEKVNVSFLEAIPLLTEDEQVKIINEFISHIPKLGKKVLDIRQSLLKVAEIMKTKKKALGADQAEEIKKFNETFESQKGSIYEGDTYTRLITNLVDRIRKDMKKQVVLIIDDTDRIDPDHIFRILNIFAAHHDVRIDAGEANKFGLDKILVSCDVENIRVIFLHRFGQSVDFSGYIDKFYSREIFYFDNRSAVTLAIDRILKTIKVEGEYRELNFISNEKKLGFRHIKYILVCMYNSRVINMRFLEKLFQRGHNLPVWNFYGGGEYHTNTQLGGLIMIDFLVSIFGNADALVRAVQQTTFVNLMPKDYGVRESDIVGLLAEAVIISEMDVHRFSNPPEGERSFQRDKMSYVLRLHNGVFYPELLEQTLKDAQILGHMDIKVHLLAAINFAKNLVRTS